MKVEKIHSLTGGDKVMAARNALLFIVDLKRAKNSLEKSENDYTELANTIAIFNQLKSNLAIYEINEILKLSDEIIGLENIEKINEATEIKRATLIKLIQSTIEQLENSLNTFR